ncbi:MAG: OPT/YSL family transporter [Phycisphaerales bacterium]|nr:OPT/YSL family transporter [Phycisphaerales bacterium]
MDPDRPDASDRSPQTTPRYREVTVAAMVFGVAFGLVMNAAITYAGLKIGFTIGGSAIAAVLGFGVLRGLLRKGTILETNVAQTVASAVNTSNSGVIFTVPVLLLFGYTLDWKSLDFWLITLACVAGAMLGTAFIIPLRKQMIDIERLRFPSATGVATILKSPGAGIRKTIVLVAGIVSGALIYLPAGLPAIRLTVPLESIEHLEQRSVADLAAVAAGSSAGAMLAMDGLDKLVYAERVSLAAAQTTRDLASWIRAGRAPEDVVQRAAIAAERRALRDQLDERIDLLAVRPVDPALKPQIAELKSRLADAEQRLADSPGKAYSPEVLLAVHRIVAEGHSWAELVNVELGWASRPLPGYADLQWRLGRDAGPGQSLDGRIDRDANGRADLALTDDRLHAGRLLGLPDQWQLIFAIAPFALGAGFITGRPGLMVLAGGILAYFVINPFVYWAGYLPPGTSAYAAPQMSFELFNRPLGIGLLLGGAIMGVMAALPAIAAALKSIGSAKVGGREELGLAPLAVAIVGAVILLFFAADFTGNKPLNEGGLCPVTQSEVTAEAEPAQYKGYLIHFESPQARQTWETDWSSAAKDKFLAAYNAKPGWLASLSPHARALIIAVVGCVWIWFTGLIIAQCTGMTDWSPISGMALLTVVLVLLMAGTGAVVGAVLIGAALCVAVTLAADMMADLKTGHLVGARPRRQQIAEMSVVWIGPVVCMFTLVLIAQVNLNQYGVAMGPGTPTTAPQAQALQAVITGVQGGMMPYALYGVGALLGVLLGLGSFAGLGVLVGLSMYLPFYYISTYGIGCVTNMVLGAIKGRRFCEEWGVPFAAGLIVGESILALLINAIVLATG